MKTAIFSATAAALTLAGTSPHGVGARVQNFTRVELEQRTFTCGGGIPGATALHGWCDGGVLPATWSAHDALLRLGGGHSSALSGALVADHHHHPCAWFLASRVA